ncbi:MAG: BadF/BadG/BcrA/BcrD ATPase family protein [Candidatus Sumerlaeia bacterium]|nr:BadF/BadG/BcrA/BcrD ATPase family protein [Candidatus Sumerlaeia bacterium]
MAAELFAIGIDGGGSHTRAMLLDGTRAIRAHREGGASNPHSTDPADVRTTLEELISGVCGDAGVPLADVRSLCLAMAGVDRPADRALIEGMVRPLLADGQALLIRNDSVAGMMAGLDELHGLMLIAGTGSICFAYHRDGRTGRAGGYGHVLGDEGSGYAMGVAAMKAVIQASDGRLAPTALTGMLLGHLGLSAPPDLVTWLLQVDYAKSSIASLSRVLAEADAAGDAAAVAIMDQMADDLASVVMPAHRQLFSKADGAVPIVFGGSNLVRNDRYQSRLRARLAAMEAPLEVVLPKRSAVEGAARYALAHAEAHA